MKHLYSILFCLFLSGCIRTYNDTIKVSGDSLFLEVFNRYPDCREYYLTDSTNFRTFFIAIDLEHEYFQYECKGDSIHLIDVRTGNKNCRDYFDEAGRKGVKCDEDTIERRTIIISQLKKNHKFD